MQIWAEMKTQSKFHFFSVRLVKSSHMASPVSLFPNSLQPCNTVIDNTTLLLCARRRSLADSTPQSDSAAVLEPYCVLSEVTALVGKHC